MTAYSITRSKRKTAAIYVHDDGSIEVRCPKNFPARDIEKFVTENLHKLERTAAQKQDAARKKEAFCIRPGDTLLFLGKEYPLECVSFRKAGFDGSRFYIPADLPAENVKPMMIKVYKTLAEKTLSEKTLVYAGQMQLAPLKVKINAAKTRWGSCSGKNSINFSWRLIMADERCVDYVVVHELAHIAEHNHSARFWAVVGKYLPDYKEQHKCLRALQKKLSAENWD
jgi:predicted metal-dependent hydrolase